MRLWRLAKGKYDPLDGEGARLNGGRWNSVGVRMVYTSEHLSLAVLEQLVHVDPANVPPGLEAFEIDVPGDLLISTLPPKLLPAGWADVTDPPTCQALGDYWAQSQNAPVLRIPSAVVQREDNYLINPLHPDAERIQVVGREPFRFDPRLLLP